MKQSLKALKGFRAFAEEKMKEWNVPGAAVAVIKEDEIIMAEGFGFRDKERKLKVNPGNGICDRFRLQGIYNGGDGGIG